MYTLIFTVLFATGGHEHFNLPYLLKSLEECTALEQYILDQNPHPDFTTKCEKKL